MTKDELELMEKRISEYRDVDRRINNLESGLKILNDDPVDVRLW